VKRHDVIRVLEADPDLDAMIWQPQ